MGSGNNSYPVPNFSPNGLKIAAFHSYVFFYKVCTDITHCLWGYVSRILLHRPQTDNSK